MGRALEMKVVAEGIETAEQVADLRELGCPLGQGYLFARPLPPEELDGLLKTDFPSRPRRRRGAGDRLYDLKRLEGCPSG